MIQQLILHHLPLANRLNYRSDNFSNKFFYIVTNYKHTPTNELFQNVVEISFKSSHLNIVKVFNYEVKSAVDSVRWMFYD